MRKYLALAAIIVLWSNYHAQGQTPGKVVVPPGLIVKNLSSFMDYYSNHVRLKKGFMAYDAQEHPMDQGKFLQQVATGNYLPLQLYAAGNAWAYRLYKLKNGSDHDVKAMVKQVGVTFYGIYQMEGHPFPGFHYVDLNGKIYTTENTRGKIIVLKAWFTSCIPCVKEMPMLNKLTEQYANRKDILFLSIAPDPKKALQDFTKRTTFKYAIVPVTMSYIQDKLHVIGYPAHWIINKQGIVVNMSYDHDEMIKALNKEALN